MRTTRLAIALTLVTTFSVTTPARAQEVTRMPETAQQAVGLDAGLENAFILRGTYAHRIDLGVLHDSRLYGRFTLPVATPDLGDWGADGGLRTTVVAWRDLRLALLGGPVLRRSSNEVFSALGVGLGATMLFGYEGPRWGLSADVGYEQLFTTYIDHSATYRRFNYAGAKDGWYALSGSTAHAGLRGGVQIGGVEIAAKLGLNTTGQLNPIIPPFYATLGAAYAF